MSAKAEFPGGCHGFSTGPRGSPWVQGVRSALYFHQCEVKLTSIPMGFGWFFRYGLTFPVLKASDSAPFLDSFQMYSFIENKGYSLEMKGWDESQLLQMQAELESLFSSYALGRCYPGKKWKFIYAWSTMREVPNSYLGTFFRAFVSIYFLILIVLGIRFRIMKSQNPYDLNRVTASLQYWEDRLCNSVWLSGESIGFLDFAFFGHIQCMLSGLTDETIPIIKEHSRIVEWLEKMENSLEGYGPMYVKRLHSKDCVVAKSSIWDRVVFWTAWIIWLLLFPLTLTFIAVALRRRFLNPYRTGAMSEKYRNMMINNQPEEQKIEK